jgi:hypothetical protein
MSTGARGVDNRSMRQLAIRCQPTTPRPTQEVEQWLETEVGRLRAGDPHASFHLRRITTTATDGSAGNGWLIELDATSGGDALDEERIDAVLRDLRLLGLVPTLLHSLEHQALSSHQAGPPATGGGS